MTNNPFALFWPFNFAAPLSGAVNQQGMFEGMLSTNYNVTIKGDPNKELGIITNVASVGSQLGTIMDVVVILGNKLNTDELTDDEKAALTKLKKLKRKVDLFKEATAD